MIPFVMMALSLAQKKQQQEQADNARISDSLNLDNKQDTKLDVPNGNPFGNMFSGQGGAMGLLGSLFNKKDPTKTGF